MYVDRPIFNIFSKQNSDMKQHSTKPDEFSIWSQTEIAFIMELATMPAWLGSNIVQAMLKQAQLNSFTSLFPTSKGLIMGFGEYII